jgi:transcriptional regulator with XRE-family HTH domain
MDELAPTTGAALADLRRQAGIEQQALADRLGMHRTTLNRVERAPQVSTVRAAKYRKALTELVAEAVA